MLSQVTTALELVKPLVETVPGVGGMIGGAIDLATKILQLVADAKVLQDDCAKLADRAGRITISVAKIIVDAGPERSLSLVPQIVELFRTLESCKIAVKKITKLKSLQRLFANAKLRDELKACNEQLDHAITLFGIKSQLAQTSILLELARLAVDSRRQLSNVEQNVSALVQAQNNYDGEFKYFRLSDFHILKTYTKGDSRLLYTRHLVQAPDGRDFMMTEYTPDDRAAQKMLATLKTIRHANIQQLIGYSHCESKTPFYITSGGQRPFEDVLRSSTLRERICLFVDNIDAIRASMQFIAEHVFEGLFVIYSPLSMTLHVHRNYRSNATVPPAWFASNGQLIFDIPQNNSPSTGVLPGELGGDPTTSYVGILRAAPKLNQIDIWVWLLDESRTNYGTQVNPLSWYRYNRNKTRIQVGHIVNGSFVLVDSYHTTEEILLRTRPRKIQSPRSCSVVTELGSSQFYAYHLIWQLVDKTGWERFSKEVLQLSTILSLRPSELCRAYKVDEYCDWQVYKLHSPSDIHGENNCPGHTLFFWEYDTTEIGPMPVENGYWSLDAEGTQTSVCVSAGTITNNGGWNVKHELNGMCLTMTRYIYIQYIRFRDGEIELIQGNITNVIF